MCSLNQAPGEVGSRDPSSCSWGYAGGPGAQSRLGSCKDVLRTSPHSRLHPGSLAARAQGGPGGLILLGPSLATPSAAFHPASVSLNWGALKRLRVLSWPWDSGVEQTCLRPLTEGLGPGTPGTPVSLSQLMLATSAPVPRLSLLAWAARATPLPLWPVGFPPSVREPVLAVGPHSVQMGRPGGCALCTKDCITVVSGRAGFGQPGPGLHGRQWSSWSLESV